MSAPYLQRRYLVSFESRRLPHIFTDVLIIGAGVAGLRAAIEAADHGDVIVLTKETVADSNSYLAQGGVAAAIAEEDSVEDHVSDTLACGAGLCDEAVVRQVVGAAPEHIRQMREWGVAFDKSGGGLELGREGGHGRSRIVHANGDATGRALTDVLADRVRELDRAKIFEQCFAVDLLTDPPSGGPDAVCAGALTWHPHFGLQIIWARTTILAGGGAGVVWRETSNPSGATADAMAMAFRAGARIADAEMMQFHPTTLYVAGATRSLISEAVRGEGGHLVDRTGERFMFEYHEMGELAPRDVVTRAIRRQMARTGSTHVYLDVRHLGAEAFAQRFPGIDRLCRSFGIDPGADLIPVHPAAHYMIGGARTDTDGRTSLGGLLACGEAACTGLHGANRLASNSLSEALVFGQRCGRLAGEATGGNNAHPAPRRIDWVLPRPERTRLDLTDIRNSLRSVMWRNVGVTRHGDRLAETLEILFFWGRYGMEHVFRDPAGWQLQNMLTAAYVITTCALRRTETRGVHCREDYPEPDPAWAKHQVVRRSGEELTAE